MDSRSSKWYHVNKKVMQVIESSDEESCAIENLEELSHTNPQISSEYQTDLDLTDLDSISDLDSYVACESDLDVLSDACNKHASLTFLYLKLAACATQNKWSQKSITQLLSILRETGLDLPQDARTLLSSPKTIKTQSKCGGEYVYFGIKSEVIRILSNWTVKSDLMINLLINIDGLPLFLSSTVQLWPILALFEGSDVFIIGIFCGNSKLDPLIDFLSDFVNEWMEMKDSGINFNGFHISLAIKAFVCDAPARAYIKNIVNHNGYNSCERCCVHGSHNGRVVFNDEFGFNKRDDQTFQHYGYLDHQKAVSPLVNIGIECISSFVLDYMHLVCLGVTKRILKYLLKGPMGKISASQIAEISNRLICLNRYMPSEFARQPRSLQDLDRWKATEFRQFLIYLGPVVLKGVVSEQVYKHFLLLSISIGIMLTSNDRFRNNHF